ncbi:MAG: hypothetical protein C5B47_00175, partial [Verrucomicrobia bacterium]
PEYKELNKRAQKADELEKINSQLSTELLETKEHLETTKNRLEEEIRLLRELLRLERIRKYGPKSEILNNGQLELLLHNFLEYLKEHCKHWFVENLCP